MRITVYIFVAGIIILLLLLLIGADRVKIGTGAIVYITVLWFAGVDLYDIGTGIFLLIVLSLALMLAFFSLSFIFSLFFRKGTASFEKINPLKNSNAGFAVYDIDGEKYYAIYPIEFMIVRYFYHDGNTGKVRVFRWKIRNMIFDRYCYIVLSIGLFFSALFFVFAGIIFLTLM